MIYIQKTDVTESLIYSSGPILPGSAELIESGSLDELMNYLKNRYEYIIIDTTPAGLVADASLMMKYASLISWYAEIIIHEKTFSKMFLTY